MVNDLKKGAVIEVVDGGYIVVVMSGGNALFGPAQDAKKVFTNFIDAFDFLKQHLAEGDSELEKLDKIERGLIDDDDPFHPNTRDS
jgi:hypothetical protein